MITAIQVLLLREEREERGEVREGAQNDTAEAALKKIGKSHYDLYEFIRKGDCAEAEILIAAAPTLVNYHDHPSHGQPAVTMLHAAVESGRIPMIDLLLDHGAQIEAEALAFSASSAPPVLQEAIGKGAVDLAAHLIARGADVNHRSQSDISPLDVAALGGNTACINLLLKAGATGDFFTAAGLGMSDTVRIDIAADPTRAIKADGLGRTALHYAVANDRASIVRLLLHAGVNPGRKGGTLARAESPLSLAIAHGLVEMTKVLIQAGADVNGAGTSAGSCLKWISPSA